jgi:large subunit ribosomal protein L36
MKVRAAIKKRSADCKIVRRKGKLYYQQKNPRLSNVKANQFLANIKQLK